MPALVPCKSGAWVDGPLAYHLGVNAPNTQYPGVAPMAAQSEYNPSKESRDGTATPDTGPGGRSG
jgi:hypothetical protein